MPIPFGDLLFKTVREKQSVAVVGIDPVLDDLPPALRDMADDPAQVEKALTIFGTGIVDAVAPHVPAVKPNIAFYEAHGLSGLMAYIQICAHARRAGLIVIGDVKRGDIGSTAAAYARGLMRPVPRLHEGKDAVANPFQIGPHAAVTLNAYLGSDSIRPFLEAARENGQGLFLLVKTSNPSSAELQDLMLAEGGTVAEAVARRVAEWGAACVGESGLSSVGAVVGATHPEELCRFRDRMPAAPFLVPGYGAQGGTAGGVMGAFRRDGSGALVNASRSVINAWQKEKDGAAWQAAATRAVEAMNEDLNHALRTVGKDAILS